MRRTRRPAAALAALILALCARPAAAVGDWQEHVTPLLGVRLRGELVDWFEPAPGRAAGAERYRFFASQLRVGFRLDLPRTRLTVVAQDTRLLALPDDADLGPPEGNLGPGALYFAHTRDRDQGEVFLKLAHLTLHDLAGVRGLAATLGRFEYASGLETVPLDPTLAWLARARIGERLLGPFGYTHVTRSFDGLTLAYERPAWSATALAARPTHGGFEVSANRELTDVGVAGLALGWKGVPTLPPLDLRLFHLYYEDGRDDPLKVDNRAPMLRAADRKDVAIHTVGGHALGARDLGPGRVDGLLWAVLQRGRWGDLDHAAWAWALEAGYQLPQAAGAPWVRVGYDRSSGDDDPADGDHGTFFQLLPTARVYAQLPFFNLMNSEDLFAQLLLGPHRRVQVRTDYHWIRVTEPADLWYAGGGATNAEVFGFAGLATSGRRELAHLVDLGVTVALVDRLTLYLYYGHAFGQGVVRGLFTGSGADYGYLELTYRQ